MHGVDMAHSSARKGEPSPNGGIGRVGMDDIDIPLGHETPEATHPPKPSCTIEAVHADTGRFKVTDQGVFPRQQVSDLVIESRPVEIGSGIDEELLGPSPAEALDKHEHSDHAVLTFGAPSFRSVVTWAR